MARSESDEREHDPSPDDTSSDPGEPSDHPGKTRTWWHPLLVQLLAYVLAGAYEVIGELLVGKMPQRLDIFILRREAGQLSDLARREFPLLVKLLNRFTIVEFKGPTDALQSGDVSRLLGNAHLWFSEQRAPSRDVTLLVLGPSLNKPVREELQRLGLSARQTEPGVHRIDGAVFDMWVLETDVLGDHDPVLALFSRMFLRDAPRIIEQLSDEHAAILYFMWQQVEQFRIRGEEYLMQFKDAKHIQEVDEQLRAAVIDLLPVEELVRKLTPEDILRNYSPDELLRNFSPDELLRRLSPEERLRGLPAEERLRGLTKEERARLRDWLEREDTHGE